MRENIINWNINYAQNKHKISESDIRIYRYGLEAVISVFTKMTVVLLVSIFLNTFKEAFCLTLFYGLLRTFGFGLHASKNSYCWIITLSLYIFASLFIKYISINAFIYYSIFLILSLLLIMFAPADTPKRPLFRNRKRNKIIICFIIAMYLFISLLNIAILNKAILIGIAIECICVNPLTYKILKIPYNNCLKKV